MGDEYAYQPMGGGAGATPDMQTCLLYTSDAADERSSVDLGGRRIIKKKNKTTQDGGGVNTTKLDYETRIRLDKI